MSCGPPCPPCSPPPPPPCPQICTPPPPMPPCRHKPIMRGLHMAQTKTIIAQTCVLALLAGTMVYMCLGRPRMQRYKEFNAKGEFEDWEDEMARKGLFQSVTKESLKDY